MTQLAVTQSLFVPDCPVKLKGIRLESPSPPSSPPPVLPLPSSGSSWTGPTRWSPHQPSFQAVSSVKVIVDEFQPWKPFEISLFHLANLP